MGWNNRRGVDSLFSDAAPGPADPGQKTWPRPYWYAARVAGRTLPVGLLWRSKEWLAPDHNQQFFFATEHHNDYASIQIQKQEIVYAKQ